jgi:hypothetical protein
LKGKEKERESEVRQVEQKTRQKRGDARGRRVREVLVHVKQREQERGTKGKEFPEESSTGLEEKKGRSRRMRATGNRWNRRSNTSIEEGENEGKERREDRQIRQAKRIALQCYHLVTSCNIVLGIGQVTRPGGLERSLNYPLVCL